MNKWFLAAALLLWAVYNGRRLVQHLHMMQQNSYRNDRFWRWLRPRLGSYLKKSDLIPVAWLVAAALIPYHWNVQAAVIGFGLISLVQLLTWRRPEEKKALAFTPRAKRLYAASCGLILIVAILAFFIDRIYALLFLSVVTYISPATMMKAAFLMQPVEKSINNRYFEDARRIVSEMPRLTVIGITGSYGKTSTKVVLGQVLAEKYHTLITPESYNTPMGVTITIRKMLKPTHEFFITEMGARQPGDVAELCALVHPKIGILTAIGHQHLETFHTIENIAATKFELVRALPQDGMAVLNLDNPYIRELAPTAAARVVSFGIESEDVCYRGKDISFSPQGMEFTVCYGNGEEQLCRTRLLGRHHAYNMLAAFAVAHEMGMEPQMIARGLWKVNPVPHRLELKRGGAITIIDDAFNSNPIGAAMALEVLAAMPEGKKIIITPGMVELGAKEAEENKAFAEKAAAVCDYIILVGKGHSTPLQEGLKAAGYPTEKSYVAADLADARAHLQNIVTPGDYVLFENDLPDTYNE